MKESERRLFHPDIYAAAEALTSGSLELPLPDSEAALAECLYPWYLNPTPIAAPSGHLQPWELDLAASLRASHADALRFEGGWRAETVSNWGRSVVERDGLTRVVNRSDYLVPARPGLRAEPGDAVMASGAWEYVDDETGFWHARRGVWPPKGADRLIRLYWNSDPANVTRLFHELTKLFAEFPSASYMVKTPANPDHNGRSDAFVMYLGPDEFATLEEGLEIVAATLENELRSAAPRFTLPLAKGLALAEGDLNGDSFGETRCRMVSEAYFSAAPTTRQSASLLSQCIATCFESAGLDPEQPHLLPRETHGQS